MELACFRYVAGAWSQPFPALDSPQTLVLAFAGPGYHARPELFAELAAAYPQATLIGCSTSGEIDQTRVVDESITVSVVKFARTRLRWTHAKLGDSRDAGHTVADALYEADLRAVMVLSDGLRVNGTELVAGLSARLPERVVVTGGLAGDGDRFGHTWVLVDGKPEAHAVVAVGLYGDAVRVSHGSKGGWDAFGPERVVTKAKGNVLLELDGKPALALYKEYLGERAAELPSSALLFPLALRASQDDRDAVVRTVLGVDEQSQAMVFAGDLPVGSYAKLMRANFDRLIMGAQDAAEIARSGSSSSSSSPGLLAIAISCVGRRLVLGERCEEEIEATYEALPHGSHQVGFYSYGEIAPAPHGGRVALHNQTMTLTLLGEVA